MQYALLQSRGVFLNDGPGLTSTQRSTPNIRFDDLFFGFTGIFEVKRSSLLCKACFVILVQVFMSVVHLKSSVIMLPDDDV